MIIGFTVKVCIVKKTVWNVSYFDLLPSKTEEIAIAGYIKGESLVY